MRLIDADALQYSDARDMLPTGQYITREEIDKAAEPRTPAHWIECLTSDHWKCSKCGDRAPIYWDGENRSYAEWLAPYCPNCGAKMGTEEQA